MKINIPQEAATNNTSAANSTDLPQVSIVIPVYNEEAVLAALFDRLYPVMDNLNVRDRKSVV
jgi:cellulose synthase/poly-beta-1,6-N-acetylglucosamine synthase-like glycosyltransferase